MTELVGEGEEERMLCPIRALAYYADRTKHIENRPRNLFVSVRKKSRALSKNALSFFIRELIMAAHRDLGENLLPIMKVRAHSVRAVATPLNFWRNRSLPQVIKAATWKTASVFSKHYLKDVSRFSRDDNVYSLGPVVAAGGLFTNQ